MNVFVRLESSQHSGHKFTEVASPDDLERLVAACKMQGGFYCWAADSGGATIDSISTCLVYDDSGCYAELILHDIEEVDE